MEHLSLEALARLVDETPDPTEGEHLSRCRRCRDELDALRNQTLGLSHLPDLRPPALGWDAIQSALESEGLVRPVSRGAPRFDGGATPGRGFGWGRSGWLQAAAGLVLLLGGVGMGMGFNSDRAAAEATRPFGEAGVAGLPATLAALEVETTSEGLTVEAAADLVHLTESWYLAALMRYRERLEAGGEGGVPGTDPLSRFAALEALVAASRVAVQEAPTDPFLNGLLVNMQAERDLALRGLQASTAGLTWY